MKQKDDDLCLRLRILFVSFCESISYKEKCVQFLISGFARKYIKKGSREVSLFYMHILVWEESRFTKLPETQQITCMSCRLWKAGHTVNILSSN